MVSLLLIVLYTSILTAWLIKISRSYRNYLSARQVTLSFVFKVIIGMFYGFLFWKFYHGDDTWQYHEYALAEYKNLLKNPASFFLDIRLKANGNAGLSAIYDTANSFWNKVDDVLLVKLLTLFDLLSFGHYYVNVVLFCFLGYLGHLLLYRLFTRYFPGAALPLRIAIFYNPVVIFWLSGIRKEGILLLALALVLFYFDRLTRRDGKFMVNLFFVFLGLLLLLVMRNFMLMGLLPALAAWLLCPVFRWNKPVLFTLIYIACTWAFFMTSKMSPVPDLPLKFSQRQHDFLSLSANTRLPLDSLNGTANSFLRVLPQAFNHSFLRPYPTESKGFLQLVSALEVLLFLLLLMLAIVSGKAYRKGNFQDPLILTCLWFGFISYLIIGYTVPFPGTFVRYKAIPELLFTCVMVVMINWNRLLPVNIIKNIHIKIF